MFILKGVPLRNWGPGEYIDGHAPQMSLPLPIQSISNNVFYFFVVCLSPQLTTGTEKAGDLW